jgi:hypothetical protein
MSFPSASVFTTPWSTHSCLQDYGMASPEINGVLLAKTPLPGVEAAPGNDWLGVQDTIGSSGRLLVSAKLPNAGLTRRQARGRSCLPPTHPLLSGPAAIREFAPEQLDLDHLAEAIRGLLVPAPPASDPDLLLTPPGVSHVVGGSSTP